MKRTITDRLIDDNIAITDFNVVQARRVCTNPCFVLDGSSLATEIRKRNQITFATLATPRKCVFHEIASFLHPWRVHLLAAFHQASKTSRECKPRGSLRRCIRIPTAGIIHALTIIPQLAFSVSYYVKISSCYIIFSSRYQHNRCCNSRQAYIYICT